MPGRSTITADEQARTALQGWHGPPGAARRIAPAPSCSRWRANARPPSLPAWGCMSARCASGATCSTEDVDHDRGWTLPRLRAEIARRGGPAIGDAWLSVQLRRKTIAGAGHGTP